VSDLESLVADLAAEQLALLDLVRGIDRDAWLTPTPAWGWDVRDTIAHLADTDDMAFDTMTDGPYAIAKAGAISASSADVTYRGVLRGRRLSGAEVADWWAAAQVREREQLAALAPDTRVPWGLGMRAPSFATARLMETWAHSLDVYAALGEAKVDTDALAHVAWLATRALPYAFSVAQEEMPAAPLRVELTLPSGAPWTIGPEDAADTVRGDAGEYCRVFVQRVKVADTNLMIEGDAAHRAMAVARAYL
jgi:uncharacterized protein (TIGR03084 family)